MTILDGIIPFAPKSGIHDQVSAAVAIERDGAAIADLKIAQKGGSVNHDHGWDLDALLQVEAAILGRGVPAHADDFDQVVEYVTDQVRQERQFGHCRGEVLASYWSLSALYRVWALRVALRLFERFPHHDGLRALVGELIVWVQVHRTLIRRFQTARGLLHHPGIRLKHHPELNENFHVLAHCWEQEVGDPWVLEQFAKLDDPTPQRLLDRAHAIIAWRMYRSADGQRIESLTRGEVLGRLATEVYVRREPDGSLRARMPKVRVIHESSHIRYPQIVFEVAVDAGGEIVERVATNALAVPASWRTERRVRAGEVYEHLDLARRRPLEGAELFGPETPLPEAPAWSPGELPPPPPPEEPPFALAAGELRADDWEAVRGRNRLAALTALRVVAERDERALAAWRRVEPDIIDRRGKAPP